MTQVNEKLLELIKSQNETLASLRNTNAAILESLKAVAESPKHKVAEDIQELVDAAVRKAMGVNLEPVATAVPAPVEETLASDWYIGMTKPEDISRHEKLTAALVNIRDTLVVKTFAPCGLFPNPHALQFIQACNWANNKLDNIYANTLQAIRSQPSCRDEIISKGREVLLQEVNRAETCIFGFIAQSWEMATLMLPEMATTNMAIGKIYGLATCAHRAARIGMFPQSFDETYPKLTAQLREFSVALRTMGPRLIDAAPESAIGAIVLSQISESVSKAVEGLPPTT